ncbi:MAG: hypothetical protein LBJ69_01750 [Holosporales bacterium]|jgi:hypothetical protein|nr:hypothetical protein [Holosporales bacterium]
MIKMKVALTVIAIGAVCYTNGAAASDTPPDNPNPPFPEIQDLRQRAAYRELVTGLGDTHPEGPGDSLNHDIERETPGLLWKLRIRDYNLEQLGAIVADLRDQIENYIKKSEGDKAIHKRTDKAAAERESERAGAEAQRRRRAYEAAIEQARTMRREAKAALAQEHNNNPPMEACEKVEREIRLLLEQTPGPDIGMPQVQTTPASADPERLRRVARIMAERLQAEIRTDPGLNALREKIDMAGRMEARIEEGRAAGSRLEKMRALLMEALQGCDQIPRDQIPPDGWSPADQEQIQRVRNEANAGLRRVEELREQWQCAQRAHDVADQAIAEIEAATSEQCAPILLKYADSIANTLGKTAPNQRRPVERALLQAIDERSRSRTQPTSGATYLDTPECRAALEWAEQRLRSAQGGPPNQRAIRAAAEWVGEQTDRSDVVANNRYARILVDRLKQRVPPPDDMAERVLAIQRDCIDGLAVIATQVSERNFTRLPDAREFDRIMHHHGMHPPKGCSQNLFTQINQNRGEARELYEAIQRVTPPQLANQVPSSASPEGALRLQRTLMNQLTNAAIQLGEGNRNAVQAVRDIAARIFNDPTIQPDQYPPEIRAHLQAGREDAAGILEQLGIETGPQQSSQQLHRAPPPSRAQPQMSAQVRQQTNTFMTVARLLGCQREVVEGLARPVYEGGINHTAMQVGERVGAQTQVSVLEQAVGRLQESNRVSPQGYANADEEANQRTIVRLLGILEQDLRTQTVARLARFRRMVQAAREQVQQEMNSQEARASRDPLKWTVTRRLTLCGEARPSETLIAQARQIIEEELRRVPAVAAQQPPLADPAQRIPEQEHALLQVAEALRCSPTHIDQLRNPQYEDGVNIPAVWLLEYIRSVTRLRPLELARERTRQPDLAQLPTEYGDAQPGLQERARTNDVIIRQLQEELRLHIEAHIRAVLEQFDEYTRERHNQLVATLRSPEAIGSGDPYRWVVRRILGDLEEPDASQELQNRALPYLARALEAPPAAPQPTSPAAGQTAADGSIPIAQISKEITEILDLARSAGMSVGMVVSQAAQGWTLTENSNTNEENLRTILNRMDRVHRQQKQSPPYDQGKLISQVNIAARGMIMEYQEPQTGLSQYRLLLDRAVEVCAQLGDQTPPPEIVQRVMQTIDNRRIQIQQAAPEPQPAAAATVSDAVNLLCQQLEQAMEIRTARPTMLPEPLARVALQGVGIDDPPPEVLAPIITILSAVPGSGQSLEISNDWTQQQIAAQAAAVWVGYGSQAGDDPYRALECLESASQIHALARIPVARVDSLITVAKEVDIKSQQQPRPAPWLQGPYAVQIPPPGLQGSYAAQIPPPGLQRSYAIPIPPPDQQNPGEPGDSGGRKITILERFVNEDAVMNLGPEEATRAYLRAIGRQDPPSTVMRATRRLLESATRVRREQTPEGDTMPNPASIARETGRAAVFMNHAMSRTADKGIIRRSAMFEICRTILQNVTPGIHLSRVIELLQTMEKACEQVRKNKQLDRRSAATEAAIREVGAAQRIMRIKDEHEREKALWLLAVKQTPLSEAGARRVEAVKLTKTFDMIMGEKEDVHPVKSIVGSDEMEGLISLFHDPRYASGPVTPDSTMGQAQEVVDRVNPSGPRKAQIHAAREIIELNHQLDADARQPPDKSDKVDEAKLLSLVHAAARSAVSKHGYETNNLVRLHALMLDANRICRETGNETPNAEEVQRVACGIDNVMKGRQLQGGTTTANPEPAVDGAQQAASGTGSTNAPAPVPDQEEIDWETVLGTIMSMGNGAYDDLIQASNDGDRESVKAVLEAMLVEQGVGNYADQQLEDGVEYVRRAARQAASTGQTAQTGDA